MTSSSVATFLTVFLAKAFPCFSQSQSDPNFGSYSPLQPTGGIKNVERRSLTYPPSSVLQINMGVTLAGQFERNSAVIVLAFQQNLHLPEDPRPLLSPSVVSARKFSIYDHLRDVIASYGFSGSECLKKIICQIGEAPLMGGLLEDVVTFVLSPSKHRAVQVGNGGNDRKYIDLLLEAERVGKLGGNCSSAFPMCAKTPLDLISAVVRV